MRVFLITCLCIILAVLPLYSGSAQESTFPVITAENANQIEPLAVIGKGFIHDVSWSPDGSRFFIASSTGVWEYDAQNLANPPTLIEIPDIDNLAQEHAFFSGDGSTLVIPTDWEGASCNRIAVWDTTSWTRIQEFRDNNIDHIIASADGNRVLFNVDFEKIVVWETVTNTVSMIDELAEISDYNQAYAVNNMGQVLVQVETDAREESGGATYYTRVYNLETGVTEVFFNAKLAFPPDTIISQNAFVFNTPYYESPRLINWLNVANPQQQRSFSDRVTPLTFSQDGDLLAMVNISDGIVEVWNPFEAKLVARLDDSPQTHTSKTEIGNPFKKLRFSPNAQQLVSIDVDDIVKIWDLVTGNLTAIETSFGRLEPVGFDNETLYVKSEYVLRRWPMSDAQPTDITYWNGVGVFSPNLQSAAVAVAPIDPFFGSGRTVAGFSIQNFQRIVPIQIWDMSAREVVAEFQVEQENAFVNELLFSADGSWLLVSLMLDSNGIRDQASVRTLVFDLGLGPSEAVLYDEFAYDFATVFINFGFATNNEFVVGLDEFRDSENFETTSYPVGLVNAETGQERIVIEDLKAYGFDLYPQFIAVNSSKTRLVAISDEVTLIDLENGNVLKRIPLDFFYFTPYPSFNPSGDILVVGPITYYRESSDSIWYSALSGDPLPVPLEAQYTGSFSNDGTLYAFEDLTGRVQIWGVGAEYIEPTHSGFQILNEPWVVYDFDASADVFSSEDGKLVRTYDELPLDEVASNASGGGGGGDISNDSSQSSTPTSAPVVQSCPGAPSPHLTVGALATVSDSTPNNLRSSPQVSASLIGEIPSGATFRVMGGPECSDGFAFWQVNYNAQIGWTAEGQGDVYWLSPYVPIANQLNIPSCDGYLVPQLTIGQQARILPGDPNALNTLPLRPSQYSESVRLGSVPSGANFTVLDGPLCGDGSIVWWLIDYNGVVGWTGEGQENTYWAEPVN